MISTSLSKRLRELLYIVRPCLAGPIDTRIERTVVTNEIGGFIFIETPHHSRCARVIEAERAPPFSDLPKGSA